MRIGSSKPQFSIDPGPRRGWAQKNQHKGTAVQVESGAAARDGVAVTLFDSAASAVRGTDAMILVTEWNEFRQIDLDELKRALKAPLVFDGRNVYDPKTLRDKGFTYYGIGRG